MTEKNEDFTPLLLERPLEGKNIKVLNFRYVRRNWFKVRISSEKCYSFEFWAVKYFESKATSETLKVTDNVML